MSTYACIGLLMTVEEHSAKQYQNDHFLFCEQKESAKNSQG